MDGFSSLSCFLLLLAVVVRVTIVILLCTFNYPLLHAWLYTGSYNNQIFPGYFDWVNLTLVSAFTTCFPLTMGISGFGPYRCLWPNDAPAECADITHTPWAMMPTLGFVSYHREYGASLGGSPCNTHNPTLRLKIEAFKKSTVAYTLSQPKKTKKIDRELKYLCRR